MNKRKFTNICLCSDKNKESEREREREGVLRRCFLTLPYKNKKMSNLIIFKTDKTLEYTRNHNKT